MLHQRGEDHRPDGQERGPAGLDPRQGQSGVEVQGGEPVGQLVELPGRELHLVDLHDEDDPWGPRGRWSTTASRARARTVPPLAMTRASAAG